MTTDTQLAPTDAEIIALLRPLYASDEAASMGAADDLRTARAVLTKWGAQPVEREPLTEAQVQALIEAKHYRPVYELKASDQVCLDWYRLGLRDGEAAHGIKGGQHG